MANAKPSSPEVQELTPEEVIENRPASKLIEKDGRKYVEDVVKHKAGPMKRRTYMDTKKA